MKQKKYKQGIYTPMYPNKYRGSSPIIYRSSIELLFMRWCDNNPNIVQWGSESIFIPYINKLDNRGHKYIPDFILKLQTEDCLKKYVVELKPFKETIPPIENTKKSRKSLIYEQHTWITNTSKWEAARAWCKQKGYEFIIVTEKDLK